MLSVKNSRLLARIKQIALYDKNIKLIKKIENIKADDEITEDILKYNKSLQK